VQFVQVVVSPVAKHEPALRVPAAQVVHGVHAAAPATDQLTPATQPAHTLSVVAEQAEAR